MIYTRDSKNEYISFNEATGTESAPFVKKEKVPKDFKATALKLVDAIESEGIKNSKGGANDAAVDTVNIFTTNIRNGVEEEGEDVRSYYFRVPQKMVFQIGATPNKFKEFSDKVFKKAGLKKGQQVADGSLVGSYYYKSSKTEDGKPCYFLAWCQTSDQMMFKRKVNLVLQCIEGGPEVKSWVESTYTISSESAADDGFEYKTPDATNKDNEGYKNDKTLEDYLGYNPELGLTRSEELSKGDYEDFFRDPKIMEKFTEHMDMTDDKTRKTILYMNEADQNAVLTSLTSKLYDKIVTKVDDIDYGDIPNTKGDITKLPNYEKLRDCISILRDIITEYKQDPTPIDELSKAMSNIMSRKDLFNKAFRMDVELPIIMYNNTVLGIIEGVSYMIATCIEFIKVPNNDSFQIVLDKMAYNKSKSNMIYSSLKKFNKSCDKGEFDKAMNHVMNTKIKNEGAIVAGIAGSIGAAVVLVLAIIPILRELVFLFYHIRMRVSDFFDIQADLLQMNAYNLQQREDIDNEKKEKTVSKQLKIVELFRKIANKISFTTKKAEVNATKEIIDDSKKTKINDLDVETPSVSALF